MKTLRYKIESAGLYLLMSVFRILPPKTASGLGAWIGRSIGPRLGVNKSARRNLNLALPDENPDPLIRNMWDHLGRVLGEYPHLEYLAKHNMILKGEENLEPVLKAGKGGILIGGHFGNWELPSIFLHIKYGIRANITYRALNNPGADKLLQRFRTRRGKIRAIPKNRKAGITMMKALRNKEYIGILIDQKYNEGLAVPFFSLPAMTNPVAVQLAQKFEVPLVPLACRRIDENRFEIEFYPPICLFEPNGKPRPVDAVISDAHTLLESWIRRHPEQWLWLHKRWDSKNQKGQNG